LAITGYNILQDTKTIKDIKTKQEKNSEDILNINEQLGDFTSFKNSKGQPNGLAELDETGNVPESQLGHMPKIYTSDVNRIEMPTGMSTEVLQTLDNGTTVWQKQGTEPTKIAEYTIYTPGIHRFSFRLGRVGAGVAYGQLYINGEPAGILRSTVTEMATVQTSGTAFIEDLDINAFDTVSLYIHNSGASYYTRASRFTLIVAGQFNTATFLV